MRLFTSITIAVALVLAGSWATLAENKEPAKTEKKAKPNNKRGKKYPTNNKALYNGEPIKALIITGGCCHNYIFQTYALASGVQKLANVEFQVVNVGGTGTSAEIDLYNNENWNDKYDVVIHNECFAKTTNPEYIKKITTGHLETPAIVVHCAMHSYRDAEIDDWRKFLGVTSRRHDHQSRYAVTTKQPDHYIMKDVPSDWVTQKDELYIIDKIWPTATTLATSISEKDKSEHPVIWTNNFNGTRVMGTTYGHTDDTFRDPTFITLLTRSIIWATEKEDPAVAHPKAQ